MDNLVPILVALIGAGGFGVFAREIADIVIKVRNGISAREGNRKTDIVAQRDAAIERASAQEARADKERDRRIAWTEYAGVLRWRLREHGIEPDPLPEDTITPQT